MTLPILTLAAVVAFGVTIIILLIKGDTTVADSLQQLDTAIAGLGTGITQLLTDTQALITAVQNIPGVDLTNEVNAINADIANLQSLDTSVTTETGQLGQGQPQGQAKPQTPPA